MSHWKKNHGMHKWPLTQGSTTQKGCPIPKVGRDSPSKSTCRYVILQAWHERTREGSRGVTPRESVVKYSRAKSVHNCCLPLCFVSVRPLART